MPVRRRFDMLPDGWNEVLLSDIATVNPRAPTQIHRKGETRELRNDDLVTFCRMEDVSEEGRIATSSDRAYGDVRSGYTGFINGDILVAKITPCFQNGKIAISSSLTNGIGFGSTEFHVVRADCLPTLRWLRHVLRSHEFLQRGRLNMQGSAGQQRVPPDFLRAYHLLAPPPEERGLVADVLDTWERAILVTQRIIDLQRELRKALMRDLLTGAKRLPGCTGPMGTMHNRRPVARLQSPRTASRRSRISTDKHSASVRRTL
jgi:type I restriction enzyme S subunit